MKRVSTIKQYESEILELYNKGLSHKDIGEKLEFTREQVKEYFHRKHKQDRKIAAGIAIKKGRPAKGGAATKEDKLAEKIREFQKHNHSTYEEARLACAGHRLACA